MTEFHGAAAGVEAIEVVVEAGDGGCDGFEVRRVAEGGLPLRDAEIRSADHADFAGTPGLMADPVEGILAVGDFLLEGAEDAFGLGAAAHILDDDGIAVIDVGAVVEAERGAFAVGGAGEERGPSSGGGRTEDIRRELDAVAHGDADVELLQDLGWEGGGEDDAQQEDSPGAAVLRHGSPGRWRRGMVGQLEK